MGTGSLGIQRWADEKDGRPHRPFRMLDCRKEGEEGGRSLWVSAQGLQHILEEQRDKASTGGQEFPF